MSALALALLLAQAPPAFELRLQLGTGELDPRQGAWGLAGATFGDAAPPALDLAGVALGNDPVLLFPAPPRLRDLGSFAAVRVGRARLVAWPFDARAFALGRHYDLAWMRGGPLGEDQPTGALALEAALPAGRVFLGVKGAAAHDDRTNRPAAAYAILAGAELGPAFVHLGFADRGPAPSNAPAALAASRLTAGGASAGFDAGRGELGELLDLREQLADPREWRSLETPAPLDGGALRVRAEATARATLLADGGATSSYPAWAAVLSAGARRGASRALVELFALSLGQVLFDSPQTFGYRAPRRAAGEAPLLRAALAVDRAFLLGATRLTPGLRVELARPASLVERPPDGAAVRHVYRGPEDDDLLPRGASPRVVPSVKANARLDVAAGTAVLAELAWSYDANRTRLDAGGQARYAPDRARQLAGTLYLRLEF